MFGLLVLPAAAEPWLDPVATAAGDCARAGALDAFLGDGRVAPIDLARKLGEGCGGALATDLRPERSLDGWRPTWAVRPWLRMSGGDAVPDNLRGDVEPGLVTGTVGAAGALYTGPFTLLVEPEVQAGLVPGVTGGARLATVWGGVAWRGLSLGFGLRDRWLGPGHHGALLVSDNARPPWLGTGVAEGRLPGWFDRVGRFRVEAGAGWLAEPRSDVSLPGLLLMDFRWLPVPWIELGATRLCMFGGVDRPAVDVGQLLVPTEPHVYEDPDQELPDQNELAALDARVTLPLGAWTGLPVEYVEAWWQYGGEDVIGRKLGPIPYPSLAGVGNLYGAAVKVAPIVVTAEYTRLLDDYFRWYIAHRVYHDGFTQDGRVMGHFGGTDSETIFGAVAWEGGEGAGGRLRGWVDWTRRVGVVEALNDKLFTLMAEEHRLRAGLDGMWRLPEGGWVSAGYSYEHVTGVDFVPETLADQHRIYVGLAPARVLGGTPSGRARTPR
ncbi:MAG: capsule assembly Wzi family protein [Pseudomonadota bacterium]|nr:capsule assembly Wzi family protein [Pseudomonadota bacterium]